MITIDAKVKFNKWTSGDLFIEVKIRVKPATLFGWAGNKRLMLQYGTDSPNSTTWVLNSESFFLLDSNQPKEPSQPNYFIHCWKERSG